MVTILGVLFPVTNSFRIGIDCALDDPFAFVELAKPIVSQERFVYL